MKIILLITLNSVLLGCTGQDKIDTFKLDNPNPVSHNFNFPLIKLRDTILHIFEMQNSDPYLSKIFFGGDYHGHRSPSQQLFFASSFYDSIPSDYFNIPNRENDIYLEMLSGTWDSRVYYSHGTPLQFHSSYILHLKKISDYETSLTVAADNTYVVNGMDGIGVHGPKRREVKVEPTSIEEYSLILFIASKLGETNLQPLNLPKY